jgi:hypothetical protein
MGLEPKYFFLMNSLPMPCELHQFTMLCWCDHRNVDRCCDCATVEINLEIEIVRVWRCTWRP